MESVTKCGRPRRCAPTCFDAVLPPPAQSGLVWRLKVEHVVPEERKHPRCRRLSECCLPRTSASSLSRLYHAPLSILMMASHPQEHEKESVIASLESLVGYDITASESASLSAHPVENNAITPGHKAASSWWRRFFPSDDTIDRLFADEDMVSVSRRGEATW